MKSRFHEIMEKKEEKERKEMQNNEIFVKEEKKFREINVFRNFTKFFMENCSHVLEDVNWKAC